MDLHDVQWGSWIGLIWFRITDGGALMNEVTDLKVPLNAGRFLSS
jgi:hypothetical protein